MPFITVLGLTSESLILRPPRVFNFRIDNMNKKDNNNIGIDQSSRIVQANKPDILLMDRASSRIYLVDITICYDDNLVKTESDKKLKHLNLAHEVVEMWYGVSAEIIPVVVSTMGLYLPL